MNFTSRCSFVCDQHLTVLTIKCKCSTGFFVSISNLNFLRFHAPAGSDGLSDMQQIFFRARDIFASLPFLPILAGNLNCVPTKRDVEILNPHKLLCFPALPEVCLSLGWTECTGPSCGSRRRGWPARSPPPLITPHIFYGWTGQDWVCISGHSHSSSF